MMPGVDRRGHRLTPSSWRPRSSRLRGIADVSVFGTAAPRPPRRCSADPPDARSAPYPRCPRRPGREDPPWSPPGLEDAFLYLTRSTEKCRRRHDERRAHVFSFSFPAVRPFPAAAPGHAAALRLDADTRPAWRSGIDPFHFGRRSRRSLDFDRQGRRRRASAGPLGPRHLRPIEARSPSSVCRPTTRRIRSTSFSKYRKHLLRRRDALTTDLLRRPASPRRDAARQDESAANLVQRDLPRPRLYRPDPLAWSAVAAAAERRRGRRLSSHRPAACWMTCPGPCATPAWAVNADVFAAEARAAAADVDVIRAETEKQIALGMAAHFSASNQHEP